MTISAMAGSGPDLSLERPVADLLGWARELFEPEARRWAHCLEPALGEAVARMARGQALDLAFEQTDAVTIEQCLSMEADKTASLMAAAARLGALYGGAAPQTADRFAAFGEDLGRAFQLADDVLGIWGLADATGKPVLSDLRSTGTNPGATVFTVIPNGASSRAQLRLRPICALLAVA
jgi:geranylgeranyl pyrophosphate synthase